MIGKITQYLILLLFISGLMACAGRSTQNKTSQNSKNSTEESTFDNESDEPEDEDSADLEKAMAKESKSGDSEETGTFTSRPSVNSEEVDKILKLSRTKDEGALLKAASEILGKDPDHLKTLNAMAVFYFDQQKYGLAKMILNRALKKHSSEPALYNNLGIIYLAEDDMRSALENFRKSVDLQSGYKIGSANLSSIYIEHKDFSRALEPLKSSYGRIKSDLRRGGSEAVDIANNYAIALMGLGQHSKAEGIFEDIVSSGARNPVAYFNYAVLLVEVLKKKSDALRIISKLKFMTEDRVLLKKADDLETKLSKL